MDENFNEQNKPPELKLDAKQAQGFLSFFKTLPNDPRAVRFFDRRDYYTAHGENASFIAKTYYHTTTALRQLGSGSDGLSSVSVSKNMFEAIARDLLLERTDHTLELYEGNGSNWRLMKSGTPGNLGSFEDVLFANNEMQDTPVVVALFPNFRENGCTVGLGYVDLTRRVLGLSEFLDDSRFTNMESALVALGCKECLLPMESGKSSESRILNDALTKCNVMVTVRKKTEFKTRDLVQDLCRLVKGSIEPVKDLVSGFEYALGALSALLSYAELLADESNYGNYTIQRYNLDSYMRLDSAAMRALNVLESKTDANKNFSLFGLMNRTCTAGMGKRLLHMWLKQPLLDVNEINTRLNLVQAFVEDTALRQVLRQHLKRIADIERLMHYLEKRRAGLQHIVKLYQSSMRLPHIKSALEQYDGQFLSLIKERYLDPLEFLSDDDHLSKFIGLVEASIDLDQLENGEFMISSSYDAALSALKEEQESLERQIHSLHERTASDLNLPIGKALKLDKGTQFGHVFRITKKEEPKIRKKLTTQFIVLETRKDGVKFTNTKLKRLGDLYQKILEEYKCSQKELVNRVVQTAATFSKVFESLAGLLSELDVLLSFADLASSCPTPYTRPDITSPDVGDIILEGSRHPCVEAQDWVNFIPNDCKLVRGKSWFQIITGPNMGGKSTFIRQVGVNILMAQVGSFVPCDKATISVRDCIFARVGAGDCQLRGVSTFMQEMLETASILKGATEKSLIIIDELGRGTSTYDGFGLAWAICEHIVEVIKAPTLFATHFHELTALAHENSHHESPKKQIVGVENYHVSAHIDSSSRKLTMLYKVEPGACDQSFGIHVAEFANFPESVVALAREKAAELEDFSPAAIILNDTKREVGSKRKREWNSDEMSDGAAHAHQFLKNFSDLPLETMESKQALQLVKKMKDDFEKDAVNFCWLQQFL
ncbi:MutS_V domain-containing protein/MutS_I domain-containing protein/MutS_II domain-containing protein/MutS_IV domain-containing protein/MutS_III domain-containing protein [Cephalotus follicularis]|uniref:DNA mismatch repair protein MSH2 n=1 Tax=Cephalotus follicularis TaxID=3775 RepID=A0A1Q3BPJ3_CEPFO|nr:MutS_V domain-containing protein/MutS_I domain-containing protein/MutS_II domain-containing protein/MutS_IV domain-containing protein/MutS_III domain-containing protein [Cephalotus follicularis]